MPEGAPVAARPGRLWGLVSPYVLDAPDPQERLVQLTRMGGLLFATGGFLGLITILVPTEPTVNRGGIALVSGVGVVAGVAIFLGARWATPLRTFILVPAASVIISISAYLAGPDLGPFAAMLYVWGAALAFYVLRRRWSILVLALNAIGYTVVLLLQYRSLTIAPRWLITVGTSAVAGALVGWLVQHGHRLAASEREALAAAEEARRRLAELNVNLEREVDGQVKEVERLGRLRRFLSDHLAEIVLDESREGLLEPHRREIAVIFIDLRGFTRFAGETEPEEVVNVLSEYHSALGDIFARFEATVGNLEGDGVMAYFNDPLPCPDPAERAVRMALEIRTELDRLIQMWERRGFDLSYGMGLSFGYATLGMMGLAGRKDYGPLGTVVNLASRLCDQAGPREILLERRILAHASHLVEVDELPPVEMKGFHDPVRYFRVLGPARVAPSATA